MPLYNQIQVSLDDVSGLNAALDDKAPTSHLHYIEDVDSLQDILDVKAYVGDSAWTDLSLINNWLNFGSPYPTAKVRFLAEGQVEIRGVLRKSTGNTSIGNEVACILPFRFCPPNNLTFAVATQNRSHRLIVESGGSIRIVGGNSSDASINCMFYAWG